MARPASGHRCVCMYPEWFAPQKPRSAHPHLPTKVTVLEWTGPYHKGKLSASFIPSAAVCLGPPTVASVSGVEISSRQARSSETVCGDAVSLHQALS